MFLLVQTVQQLSTQDATHRVYNEGHVLIFLELRGPKEGPLGDAVTHFPAAGG